MGKDGTPSPKRAKVSAPSKDKSTEKSAPESTSKKNKVEKYGEFTFLEAGLSKKIIDALGNDKNKGSVVDNEGSTYFLSPDKEIKIKKEPSISVSDVKKAMIAKNLPDYFGFAYDKSNIVFAWITVKVTADVREIMFSSPELDKEIFGKELEKATLPHEVIFASESWTYERMKKAPKDIILKKGKYPIAPTRLLDKYTRSYKEKLNSVYDFGTQVAAGCSDVALEEGAASSSDQGASQDKAATFMKRFSPESLGRLKSFAEYADAFLEEVMPAQAPPDTTD